MQFVILSFSGEESVVFQIWNWTSNERRICEWLWFCETNVFALSPSRFPSSAHARPNAFKILPLSFSPHVLYHVSVCYCIHWHLHLNGPSGTSCLVQKELPYVLRHERGKTHSSALMIHDTSNIHRHVCGITI